ncbi:MAG TPA: bifunctional tetrahydrofolate synthase/dihydrofolate synthase, partial [Gammaproteobacteria bacterium]|nr:bifunctional tetrahydrofolate synthase/dihydrofolate synthase [Gammaproteobacteria bacterium]
MRFTTLHDWLAWQETQHAKQIDLGLERSRPVLQRLGLQQPAYTVISVAGTNGKGSSVAFLEAMLRAAGYRVGAYSSPHLLRYNERIRLNGAEVDDTQLCAAFERIDQARQDISLTYFEFGTLAAFDIFQRAGVDVAVLEVGMGGRLDATNLLDADAALITSIGIDHIEFLGPDRESIGREKAGIFRPGRPAICADPEPPRSLIAYAEQLAAPLYMLGHDFGYTVQADAWSWWGRNTAQGISHYTGLPFPKLAGAFQLQNAAGAIMTVAQLAERLSAVQRESISAGLVTVNLQGRFQVIPGLVTRVFDVAHNPHGARVLAQALRAQACAGRTLAVFAMLGDKDIPGVLEVMHSVIDEWHVAGLALARAATANQMAQHLVQYTAPVCTHANVAEAYLHALAAAQPGDRVV